MATPQLTASIEKVFLLKLKFIKNIGVFWWSWRHLVVNKIWHPSLSFSDFEVLVFFSRWRDCDSSSVAQNEKSEYFFLHFLNAFFPIYIFVLAVPTAAGLRCNKWDITTRIQTALLLHTVSIEWIQINLLLPDFYSYCYVKVSFEVIKLYRP